MCMCIVGLGEGQLRVKLMDFEPLGGRVKTWKRRWFILTDNCLYYFEYTTVKDEL